MEGNPCTVRDGKFLEPCFGLASSVAEAGFKASGIHIRTFSNFVTRQPSRTFAVVRTKGGTRNDIILNFCPFCGERIDAPWREEMAAEPVKPEPKPEATFHAPWGVKIEKAAEEAVHHAKSQPKPIRFVFNDWETTVRATDTAHRIVERYERWHHENDLKPEERALVYHADKGVSIVTAIREALARVGQQVVRLHFNDWETTVRVGDTEQGLHARWQRFQETRRRG